MNNKILALLSVAAASIGSAALAVPVASFTGIYDEATGIEATGDYDNIGPNAGNPNDVGAFDLFAGANIFSGSVFTPDDSSDAFNIVVGDGQTLVGASIVFGENATPFLPTFGFPAPQWTLQESDTDPVIFDLAMPETVFGPTTITAPDFSVGPQTYGVLIGNGTFAMNDNSPIDYTMTFLVEEDSVNVVPVPAGLPLILSGLGLLAIVRRKRTQKTL